MIGNKWKVYKWTSMSSGKSYIGITKQSMRRRAGPSMTNYKSCRIFWRAIQKYGVNDFAVTILHDKLSEDAPIKLETQEIINHKTLSPDGYNLTSGGENPTMSDETRQRISEVKNNPSEETRKKIGDALRGRKRPEHIGKIIAESNRNRKNKTSDETRRKLSEIGKGNKNGVGKRSELTRKRISEGQKGFKNHAMRRRIKGEWMYIISVAMVYYETHNYRMKREMKLFKVDKPINWNAEQLDMFAGENE